MAYTKSFFTVTPVGEADYPYLNTPDTKFDATGVYHVKLMLDYDDPEATELAETLSNAADAEYQAAVKNAAGKRVKQADAPFYVGEYQGKQVYILKAKMNAGGINSKTKQPFTQNPRLFNAKGELLGENDLIFSGSKLRLNIEVVPFTSASIGAGVSLRLKDVLVVQMARGKQASPFDKFLNGLDLSAPAPSQKANPFGGNSKSAPPVSEGGDDDGYDF